MTQPTICPYLGLAGDRTLTRTQPDPAHRCYAQQPPAEVELPHQAAFCLAAAHDQCPFYAENAAERYQRSAQNPAPAAPADRRWPPALPWIALAALAVIVAAVYARDLLRPPAPAPTPLAATAPASATPARAPSPAPSPTAAVAAALPATATPEPGGRALALAPKSGEAGWFASGEARGNHLGDSFLYAGYFGGQAFISAVRFDISSVPRGAPIRAATLQLTGLLDDRFDPAAGGVWSVHLLPAAALADYARAGFQELFNAPAAVALVPTLYPADLQVGRPNTWALDAGGRAWLEEQLLDGATAVIARITGPAGGSDTLFAWDGGAGPATVGEGPRLTLNLGAAPPTPPPLPTEAVIVATLTATPANVLTAAAEAWTATAVAQTIGTYTPLPYRAVTPTPSPANLATVQAYALLQGLPPVVPHTPTPANQATADYDARLATAQAFLTGTPTPTPQGAVTPVVLTPTPQPTNVLTAAARFLAATAQAAELGTPTPWPYNAVIATVTPPWIVITPTPPPANAATAEALSAYATAVSLVYGAATPLPPNAATPTPPGYRAPAPPAEAAPPPSAGSYFVCPDPRAQITDPTPGQVVQGLFTVYGTAAGDGFARAVLEVAGGSPPTGAYTEFGRFDFIVQDNVLGWTDARLPNGPYTVRLRVVDAADNTLAACEVGVTVRN